MAAARTHTLPARSWPASQLRLPTLADGGDHGAGAGIHTPIKKSAGHAPHAVHVANRTYNQLLGSVRATGEQAVVALTHRWRILSHSTLSPSRIGDITRAALVLNSIWK